MYSCDNMVFERNRLLIINDLLKETELIAIEDLKKRLQIINPKIDRRGIDRDHFIPLKKEGIIEYGSLPKPRGDKPPQSVDAVRIAPTMEALIQLIKKYPDIIKLHSSPYCQGMINETLAENIIRRWYPIEDEDLKRWSPPIIRISEIPGMSGNVKNLIRLLQMSPTALKTALAEIDDDGKYVTPQGKGYDWGFFKARLFASVILDGFNIKTAPRSVYGWINGTIDLKIGIDDDGKYVDDKATIKMVWGNVSNVPGFDPPAYFDVSTEEGIQKKRQWDEKWG